MIFLVLNMLCTSTVALPTVRARCTVRLFFVVLGFVLSREVAQVFFELFVDGSSCPYYYGNQLCFHIPDALNFHCKVHGIWYMLYGRIL